ncbi:XDJ1 [Candida pseudojiufengensis]|uniref:XDJ1 n=1 Tax=Candida pseudojiufengensis TaxID=497109 RepID=UPI0022253AA4|nr:XDJ1 [Candida pseudojiufengensis]KAI5964046.1 XDJ1 [Candida pseudojiufengensis]
MQMDDQNLYEILEIDSSATSVEIKKAYRKLALKYHPDKVAEEDREESEIHFKKISFAYEILIDETKRENYDTYGTTDSPFEQFYGGSANDFGANDFYDFFRSDTKPKNKTEDAHIKVEVTLEELYIGKVIRTASTRNKICVTCKGSGLRSLNVESKKCGICNGEGFTRKIRRVAPGLVAQDYVDCTTCHGSGKIYRTKDRCKTCKGARIIEETKILEFEIPKGSANEGSIVKKGESDEYPGKTTGDIILDYQCKKHSKFERRGDDLIMNIKIFLVDALTGFEKTIEHLDGRGIKVHSKKVIRPGDYIKITGEGMPKSKQSWFKEKTGDLYIKVDIEFPQDNWFVEKGDIEKLKNLIPGKIKEEEKIHQANIQLYTDFTIVKELPELHKPPQPEKEPEQPQCNQQ